MPVDQRLLHRMQPVGGRRQVFDGEQRLAVERGQELDAGIDGAQAQLFLSVGTDQFADDDGAGAAVTFGATFLGAGLQQVFAQILEHRTGRRRALDGVQGAAEIKLDGAFGHDAERFSCCDGSR